MAFWWAFSGCVSSLGTKPPLVCRKKPLIWLKLKLRAMSLTWPRSRRESFGVGRKPVFSSPDKVWEASWLPSTATSSWFSSRTTVKSMQLPGSMASLCSLVPTSSGGMMCSSMPWLHLDLKAAAVVELVYVGQKALDILVRRRELQPNLSYRPAQHCAPRGRASAWISFELTSLIVSLRHAHPRLTKAKRSASTYNVKKGRTLELPVRTGHKRQPPISQTLRAKNT